MTVIRALLMDIRFAFRQLRASRGFTLTAVFALALGVGVAAAVCSVTMNVLLRPLPYPAPGDLVGVAYSYPYERPNAEQVGTAADFIRTHSQVFSSSAVMDDSGAQVNLSLGEGHAVQATALKVSEGYFRTLGVEPALGRPFVQQEDLPNGPRAVILSNGFWTHAFNADPSIVGRAVRINQEQFTVVGVMPAHFAVTAETAPGVMADPDFWQPLQLSPKDPGYDGDNYEMIARLRPGVTIEQARQQLNALTAAFYLENPKFRKWYGHGNVVHEFRAFPLQDVVVGRVRRSLITVFGAALAVLLVTCLNIAGLMIARAMGRSRELAVRTALGATRAQLVRLIACEGSLLAVGGGVLGIAVEVVSARLMLQAAPLAIPDLHGGISPWMLGSVVFGIAVLAMGIFSILPAWIILRGRERRMQLGASGLGETISQARLSRALIVTQVAIAMVLVSSAVVLMGSFVRLQALPSGVESKQLAVFQVSLKGDHYASTRQTAQFINRVLDDLNRTPGVERVAAVNGLPLDRGLNEGGAPADRPRLQQIVEFRAITPGYFRTMGIPLLAGRDIDADDHADGDPVAVISETAARRWWPGRSPIGESVRMGDEKNWRIVGIVADARTHSLVETDGLVVYAPIVQLSDELTGIVNGWFPTSFAVRTEANVNLALAAQRAVEQADPEIPIARLTTMQRVIDSTIREPRFFSLLATGFSCFALALAVIGLYGLLSYRVTRRTREIGVRMALGADRAAILRVFLSGGVGLAVIGIGLGAAGSLLLRPVVHSILSDTGMIDSDSATNIVMNGALAAGFAVIAILIAAVAASWLPARRAAAIEPMQALRME
ncbi:MAG: ABC transporter permease [Terracidiphilus sp.]